MSLCYCDSDIMTIYNSLQCYLPNRIILVQYITIWFIWTIIIGDIIICLVSNIFLLSQFVVVQYLDYEQNLIWSLLCAYHEGGIVNNTLRPPIPERCDLEWRKLMEECWSQEPEGRPSFTEITNRLRIMSKALQPKRLSRVKG